MKKKDLQLTNDLKAHIKDIEYQIDCLIGYSPQGLHWKQEYHIRRDMLEAMLADSDTPQEIIEKLNKLQNKLYEIRNDPMYEQVYLETDMDDYKITRQIPVNHYSEGIFYIEL